MPRRNLSGGWGESTVVTVRLTRRDVEALGRLAEGWGVPRAEAIRRAVREADVRTSAPRPAAARHEDVPKTL